MSRTRLFRWLKQHFRGEVHAHMDQGRRAFSKALGVAALAASMPISSLNALTPVAHKSQIAIVGAGLGGLTTAYRLMQSGLSPVLFEASTRLGGRVHTRYRFTSDNQFSELGGEFVDTDQHEIRDLCKELGVGLTKLTDEEASDLFHFDGVFYTEHDLEIAKQRGNFSELAHMIAKDAKQLYDGNGAFTEYAKSLDQLSLKSYLARAKNTKPWVIKMIEVAYTGEFGLEVSEQSCLNLIDMMGPDAGMPSSLFGDSDEAWRIEGGSQRIIDALAQAVKATVPLYLGTQLVGISHDPNGKFSLTFSVQGKLQTSTFDYVVLALPFTILRQIKTVRTLNLTQEKQDAIEHLGYGTNAKVIFEMQDRNWSKSPNLPEGIQPSGTFYSDLIFQNIWDSSRKQPGEHGILTAFLGGDSGLRYPADLINRITANLKIMLPDIDTQFTGNQASFFWAKHRFSQGSYTCCKTGQYTSLLPYTAMAELDGTLYFAGEHTSQDFQGFMNGAVESGNRVARELLKKLSA
jgi:monoamine oxidase